MKRRVEKEPEGGSKERKQVGNDNSLASMFAKQQAASDLNKAREEYNAQLQKGKEIGLEEAAQAEPVRRSEKDTLDIEARRRQRACFRQEHGACNSAKAQCGHKLQKHLIRDAACEMSVQ